VYEGRSAGDAQDGPAVRDLTAAVDRVQPRPAQRAGSCRREIGNHQRAPDEAGDVAVVEPGGLVDRLDEIERHEPARPGRDSPLAPAVQHAQRAHGSTRCSPGTIRALSRWLACAIASTWD
jgi:hypothetical protein